MKFEELSELNKQFNTNELEDNSGNSKLNSRGEALLSDYHNFIKELQQFLAEQSKWIKEDITVEIVSLINTGEKGTEEFKTANRLDSLTSAGQTKIDRGTVAIHDNDDIIDYIEK
jgi:ferritin-like metal-binding protein YciE